MRAAAFIAGTVIVIGVFLVIAATAGFGAAAIGIGSLAILAIGAVSFVMSEPGPAASGPSRVSWES